LHGAEAGANSAGERASRIMTWCNGKQLFIKIVYFERDVHSKIDGESSLGIRDHLTIFCIHSLYLMS
jgi:hypothetical protein